MCPQIDARRNLIRPFGLGILQIARAHIRPELILTYTDTIELPVRTSSHLPYRSLPTMFVTSLILGGDLRKFPSIPRAQEKTFGDHQDILPERGCTRNGRKNRSTASVSLCRRRYAPSGEATLREILDTQLCPDASTNPIPAIRLVELSNCVGVVRVPHVLALCHRLDRWLHLYKPGERRTENKADRGEVGKDLLSPLLTTSCLERVTPPGLRTSSRSTGGYFFDFGTGSPRFGPRPDI